MSATAPSTPESAAPRRMSTNRSFTVPSKMQTTSRHIAPTAEIGAAEGIETLYVHPNANIIKFSTSGPGSRPSSSMGSPRSVGGDSAGGNIPWKNATERAMAAGPMEIYRVPGSVSFLHSGSLLHAIMPRSQCWCVDGVSKFAFRVLPDTYYRIELPGETPEDLEKVEELKLVLAKVLFYERSACPFARGFHVEVNEDEALKQPKGLGRQKSQGRAKRWTLQGEYSWKPEDWEERQRLRAERERGRVREAQEKQQTSESDEGGEGEDAREGAQSDESQEGAQGEEAEANEDADDVPDIQTPKTPNRPSFIAAWRSLTSPAQLNPHSSPTPGRIRIPKGFEEDAEADRSPEALGAADRARVRTWQNVPTSMPPSPPDSSGGTELGDTAGFADPRRQDVTGGSEQESSSDETVEAEKETVPLLDVPQKCAPPTAPPTTEDLETSQPPALENEQSDDQPRVRREEAVTETRAKSLPPKDDKPPEPTSGPQDPFAAIQARILARRSIGGNASLGPSPQLSSSSTPSSNANTTSRRSTADTTTTTTRYNGGREQAYASALVRKAATVFLGPPVELAVIMLRIAARISGRAFGSSFIIASPAGSKHVPGSFNLESIDADELDDEDGTVGDWAEDDFGVPLQSPLIARCAWIASSDRLSSVAALIALSARLWLLALQQTEHQRPPQADYSEMYKRKYSEITDLLSGTQSESSGVDAKRRNPLSGRLGGLKGSSSDAQATNEQSPDSYSDIESEGSDAYARRQSARRQQFGLESSVSDTQAPSETVPTSQDEAEPSKDSSILSKDPSTLKRRSTGRRVLSHIIANGPAYPRSMYEGWEPPIPAVPEMQAIEELRAAPTRLHAREEESPEFTYFELDDFSIFRPVSKGMGTAAPPTGELVTLDRLQVHHGDYFLLDGILSCGAVRHYVRKVPFRVLTIDGYGDDEVASVSGRICLQSFQGRAKQVWYKLGQPSSVYNRFYAPFLWLAHFTKYFVDYLLETERVALSHFRSAFMDWLGRRWATNPASRSWLSQVDFTDFRTTVNANVRFLWKEYHSVEDNQTRLDKHPVWGEVNRDALTAIAEQPNLETETVVTPFVYACFKRMYFHKQMRARPLANPEIKAKVEARKARLGLTPLEHTQSEGEVLDLATAASAQDLTDIQKGDVICVEPDKQSRWKSEASVWYAYVQRIRITRSGRKHLDILWLYQVGDTTLGAAYYPFTNELFLSDNCACGQDAIDAADVVGKVAVEWGVLPAASRGYFVRQKFRTVHEENTYDFVTLQKTDFECSCGSTKSEWDDCIDKYRINDTVLVLEEFGEEGEKRLQPARVLDFDHDTCTIEMRRISRKSETTCERARPNELVLTNATYSVGPEEIIRRCHVQCFNETDVLKKRIPTPYDRDGEGDFYFYTAENVFSDHLPSPNTTPLSHLLAEQPKLTGMGVFCGGGNFDRGLEEGGAVKFKFAVDWAERALHSYRANTDQPDDTHFFLGSVNDCLAQAIAGSREPSIAQPGDVNLLAGGSPCPGFSRLQPDKLSLESLTNASMVASFVSFVDFLVPEYCILENVVTMTEAMGGEKDQNVFAQLLASFVAMGYQVQQFLMDSWSYGSCQKRSRVFIVASAPGLVPWPVPPHTHDHPSIRSRNLGRSSNGLPFGNRREYHTPFPHRSAAEACGDLPAISDAQLQICPSFPDHRTPQESSVVMRNRIAAVPKRPRGMGIVQAANMGLLSGEPLDYVKSLKGMRASLYSKSVTRIVPESLFETIITKWRLVDGKLGRALHWDEDRSCTVMELRRAQGFPDHEVIIGTPPEQVMIIGNSVDRKVSFALGLSLRQSWSQSVRALDKANRSHVTQITDKIGRDTGSASGAILVSTEPSPSPEPLPSREELIQQSRTGTLRMSDSEIQEIRHNGGFRAIRRILDNRTDDGSTATVSTASD
ncbi:S-adenosyl-L-methionine-dependent methyltransferase [Hortaea werneckii]|nr:S-adenosyl-L-methionine-dependent methyltransferase [Hortaea werneckii]